MAALSDYVTGTITLTTGEIEFTGDSTGWLLAGFKEGDTIIDVTGATEFMGVIASISDNTTGTLTKPWEGPTVTTEYRMRFLADGQRVTAQARNLIELLGNGRLTAIASAPETDGVIEILPGGFARLVPLTDLVSGAAYDVQVADMAARAAFDGQVAGFAVLVADTGDGRAAIFSKLSNASADWSAAAYVTGPAITLDITEVDEVPYGSPPDVTLTPRPGGYDLSFEIPRGMIIEPGTTTTLAPDQPAAVDFVPITGGFRLDIAIPRGPTGDITGVTPFWNTRLGADVDASAALTGLGFSDFAKTLIDDADAGAARTTLGANDASNLSTGTLPDARVSVSLSPDKAFRRGNILGTVSQTAGVPTGAILERGSNANGSYVRYADGTQICWFKFTNASVNINTPSGAIFYTLLLGPFAYPASFSATPLALLGVSSPTWALYSSTDGVATVTQWPGIFALANVAATGISVTIDRFAIGRWF